MAKYDYHEVMIYGQDEVLIDSHFIGVRRGEFRNRSFSDVLRADVFAKYPEASHYHAQRSSEREIHRYGQEILIRRLGDALVLMTRLEQDVDPFLPPTDNRPEWVKSVNVAAHFLETGGTDLLAKNKV